MLRSCCCCCFCFLSAAAEADAEDELGGAAATTTQSEALFPREEETAVHRSILRSKTLAVLVRLSCCCSCCDPDVDATIGERSIADDIAEEGKRKTEEIKR